MRNIKSESDCMMTWRLKSAIVPAVFTIKVHVNLALHTEAQPEVMIY